MKSVNRAIMIQGTTSDAGKSALAAGICRVLKRKGIRVAPFKPQNMALNSAVTADGGEIGRAQAAQAQACGVETNVHMNPILLKPNSDVGSQVIVQGHSVGNMEAWSYHNYKKKAMPYVLESFQKLCDDFDFVVVEGAGSPAEINLRENDIANMGFAEAADVPVVIVADIDRGGVFAHLYGTLALLSESEQNRVAGFVINRFRGDIKILEPGLKWLEEKTGKPVLGVLPYLHEFHLEAEDAVATMQAVSTDSTLERPFVVAVPVFKRISNHTDFDALRVNPAIELKFVKKGERLQGADLIILPGSKSTRQDLALLKEQGWDKDIYRHLRFGGKVMGICGGYQMLGTVIHDPNGVESQLGSSQGLGLLNIETVLTGEKSLTHSRGTLNLNGKSCDVSGYEIHVGQSKVQGVSPIKLDSNKFDGALDQDNQVFGTYLHGIFDTVEATKLIFEWAGLANLKAKNHNDTKERAIDMIAEAVESNLDLEFLKI